MYSLLKFDSLNELETQLNYILNNSYATNITKFIRDNDYYLIINICKNKLIDLVEYYSKEDSIVVFETNIEDYIKNLKVEINPVQEGSGEPSPENIRPITGWSSATVSRTGKNLLDYTGLTWTPGLRDDNGNIVSSGSHFTNGISVKPSTQYTLSGTLAIGLTNFRLYYLQADGTWISRTGQQDSTAYTFITPSNCGQIQIQVGGGNTLSDAQLELGSTASAYEAYQGTTIPIIFPADAGTVYGGTLNVTTGELTVTHGFYVFTGNENLSMLATGYTRFWYSFDTDGKQAAGTNQIFSWTKYANVPTAASPSGNPVYGAKVYNYSSGARIIFSDPSFPTTKSEMCEILRTAYESRTPYCFTYQMKHPITYRLTPQEVRTILGTNTIWSDSGNVSLEYPFKYNI